LEAARKVALSDTTVLITGETGTGKELIARALHYLSTRRGKALIRVACSALPETLIESELFGHEKGAFTGAVSRKEGRFELASGGTLFLDEIGDVPPSVQVKLLRALQEREIERLGGTGPIRVDARIIAATNRNLEVMVADGRFREDLYYRLNVFPIVVPPLRDRREDLPVLAEHFLKKHARRLHRRVTKITPKAMNLFLSYDWPGNVRELEHLIERAVILCEGDTLGIAHIDFSRRPHQFQAAVRGSASAPERLRTIEDVKRYGEQVEREFLRQTLLRSGGRIYGPGGAAEALGVKPTTLQSRLAKLGLSGRRAAPR
jgi:transcriptional regulator with GAF, ATPase, and Fis domain